MRKISVSVESLRARPLFIATPMYGGMCSNAYAMALVGLTRVMVENGLDFHVFSLANESLVTRARNYCVREFLGMPFTHLLFIDADIQFTPDDVISLLAYADPESDKDVICGLYPKKHIRWNCIAAAAKRGLTGDSLAACGSEMVFNPVGLEGTFDLFQPLEATEAGSGFMMIQRKVFERFAEAYPSSHYISDGLEREDGKPAKILSCFDTHITPEGRYLSEDFNFCRIVREMGMKVWVAPWLQLNHLGHYKFIGNPQAFTVSAENAVNAA